jgi:hypothetical protein
MSENPLVALEDVVNVNVGPIMIELAKRISRCSGVSSQRLKIKFCTLCENFSSRTDDIALRNDSAARHEVLGYILQWMSPVKVCELFCFILNFLSHSEVIAGKFSFSTRP